MKDYSLDTTKENASIVGSSLTESEQDGDHCDDPGSSSCKENDDFYSLRTEKHGHPVDGYRRSSSSRNEKPDRTRYFIIKSLSYHNIQLSIEKGIWATQVMNEPILEEAFHNSSRVILIFSVNMSGFFQGYAQMMSSVGWRRENVWSESSGGSNPWGRTFKVKWLQVHNLPFQKTIHLRNPLNDYKPVKISRDCQELSQDAGEALCRLIDGNSDVDGKLQRNTDFKDEFLLKRSCRETPVPLQDENCASVSSSNMPWARASVLHPLLYQHSMLVDGHNIQTMHGMSSGESIMEHLPDHSEAPKGSWMNHSHIHGSPVNRQEKRNAFFPFSDEDPLDEKGPTTDSMSEEDILDMTYEEYLQAHGRSNMTSAFLVDGRSWWMQGLSKTSGKDDDRYSKYLADWYRSQNKNIYSYYDPAHN